MIAGSSLTTGVVVGCGCVQRERAVAALKASNTRHGHAKRGQWTRTYGAWVGMHARMRPSYQYYERYGGRGITVCPAWDSFDSFLRDMGECPDGMSLDRIDSDGNYEPGNCRWADARTQANNRRSSARLTVNGQTRTVTEWARAMGIPESRIRARLRYGWGVERAVTDTRKWR